MSKRLIFLLPVVGFIAIAAVIAYFMLSGKDAKIIPSALIDKPAPEFSLPSLDGAAGALGTAHLKGQVSLLNVFASWCIPCKVEHPQITRLGKIPGVALYGLNYKDKAGEAKAWLERLGNPYHRIGADTDGRAGIEWGVYGVPETFIVDAMGQIRYKHVGPIMPRDLEETILPIIESLMP
ncbi:MAG: DsbE family thiol:disulfide interchange protein [Alphaproteobacteria bacterium]